MSVDRTGALANVKRTDYLPFGEDIGAGAGIRTAAQGYSQWIAGDRNSRAMKKIRRRDWIMRRLGIMRMCRDGFLARIRCYTLQGNNLGFCKGLKLQC